MTIFVLLMKFELLGKLVAILDDKDSSVDGELRA